MLRKALLLLSIFLFLLGAAWVINNRDLHEADHQSQVMTINQKQTITTKPFKEFKAREYVKIKLRTRDE